MASIEPLTPTFHDEFERLLDSGWRIVLPKDWRSLKVTEFIAIENSASSAIRVFPRAEFEKHVVKIETNPELKEKVRNDLLEEFGSRSKRVVPDKEGRLTLPQGLCAKIGISPDNNPKVVLRGAVRCFVIWNAEKLNAIREAHAMLEAVGEHRTTPQDILGI